MADNENTIHLGDDNGTTIHLGDNPVETVEKVVEATPLKFDVDDSMLNEAEKAEIAKYAETIDIHSTEVIVNYGAGVQKKMADFSSQTLNSVRTKDIGEVGNLLSGVVAQVKGFDESTEKKGFLGLFKKAANKVQMIQARYDQAETNITKICNELESHQVALLKDVATFDKMYDMNLTSYKEITMYILAGKKRLDEVRAGELKELQEAAAKSGKTEDAQKAKDLADQCDRFEKKLYDLNLTRTISQQTAPQIRLLQHSDTQMAEKIQSVLVNTIPLWKNQMVIAIGIQHSQQAIAAESAVTQATNELLQQNAQTLHMASIETAKANERGIVDLETLKKTNEQLIATLEDVRKIQTEGKAARASAELELQRMEGELKQKLIEMSTK